MTIYIDNTFVDFNTTAKSKKICFDYQESDDILEKLMSMEAKKTTKIILSLFSLKIELYYDGTRHNFSGMEWKIHPSFDRTCGQSAGSRKLKFPLNTTSPKVEFRWKLYSRNTNSKYREQFFGH